MARFPLKLVERDALVHVPVFRTELLNQGTPDEATVHYADNRVFKVIYTHAPVARLILKIKGHWDELKKRYQ